MDITLHTKGPGLYEFTALAAPFAASTGLLTLFVQHTSCSLLIQENADPDVRTDLKNWLDHTIPPATHPSLAYLRHTAEGPDDMPAHIKAALLPTSLQIPVRGGRMCLGTWQVLYLVEHRTRPHTRRIVAHLSP